MENIKNPTLDLAVQSMGRNTLQNNDITNKKLCELFDYIRTINASKLIPQIVSMSIRDDDIIISIYTRELDKHEYFVHFLETAHGAYKNIMLDVYGSDAADTGLVKATKRLIEIITEGIANISVLKEVIEHDTL